MIRKIEKADIPSICKIYNYYITNTIITFEEEEVTEIEMEDRIEQVTNKYPWLIFEENKNIVGYAYASPWKGRCAYRFSAEGTIYLDQKYAGKGIGSKLYECLIPELKSKGVHSLIGGIALPNEASVALHERFGFKKCAHFNEVGRKFDQWIDVGYWEKIL